MYTYMCAHTEYDIHPSTLFYHPNSCGKGYYSASCPKRVISFLTIDLSRVDSERFLLSTVTKNPFSFPLNGSVTVRTLITKFNFKPANVYKHLDFNRTFLCSTLEGDLISCLRSYHYAQRPCVTVAISPVVCCCLLCFSY